MYYILRTHGELASHWGFTCIGTCQTKKQAKNMIKDKLAQAPTKDKYVIAKLISAFHYENISNILNPIWEIKEL